VGFTLVIMSITHLSPQWGTTLNRYPSDHIVFIKLTVLTVYIMSSLKNYLVLVNLGSNALLPASPMNGLHY
jgi:hypothetical protein